MKVSRDHLLPDHHVIHSWLNISKEKLPVKIRFETVIPQLILSLCQFFHFLAMGCILWKRFLAALDLLHFCWLGCLPMPSEMKQKLLAWFTDVIMQEIRLWRFKEIKWLKDKTQYNFQAFRYQRRHVANIIQAVKQNHYSNLLVENKINTKEVFNIANKLLYRNEPLPLLPTDGNQLLANDFNEFFITKVQIIMNNLQPSDENHIDQTYIKSDYLTKVRFNTF